MFSEKNGRSDLLKFSGVPLSFLDALASRVDYRYFGIRNGHLFEGTNFPAQRRYSIEKKQR